MRATTETKRLLESVKLAKHVMSKGKQVLPVLESVLVSVERLESVSADCGMLTVAGTSLDAWSFQTLPARVPDSGGPSAACVNRRALESVLASWSAETVTLWLESGERDTCSLTFATESGSVGAVLPCLPADEYPRMPALTPPAETELVYEADALAGALERVLPFVSRDDMRPSLCGVALERRGDTGLVFTSTDGHRLSALALPVDGGDRVRMLSTGESSPAVYNTAGLSAVCAFAKAEHKLAKREHEPVAHAHVTEHAEGSVSWLCVVLVGLRASVLVRGETGRAAFPLWRNVIPQGRPACSIRVERDALASALKGLLPLTDKLTHQVVLESTRDTLKLCVSVPRAGMRELELPAELTSTGENTQAFRAGYNARYLADVCSVLPRESVLVLEPSSPVGAAKWYEDGERGAFGLLMPLRIQ